MQKFKYTAINFDKMKFTGTFFAENEEALREELAKQRLYLVKAKAISDAPPSAFLTASGGISIKELTIFCRQFAIMINAGVSVIDCLEVLKEQSYTSFFKKVLARVYEDVKSGLLLSEAMAKHKRVFPEYFRSMTYVGEVGGVLDKVMVSVADYYETDHKIRSKVKSALAYPIVLLCLTVVVLAVLTMYVIPTFKTSLAVMDVPMPGITLAMFNISEFFLAKWKEILIVIFVVVAFFVLLGKTKRGRYFYDTLKVRIPFMKKIQVATVTSRFARGFGLLIESGMDIVDALDVMANLMGNKNIERRFRMAIEDVKQGVRLALALDKYKIFPQLLIQMIAVGENTGAMDEVLLKSCDHFDSEVQNALNSATTMIQPIILVIMGGAIGVVFISIYAPILSIMQTL
ncbi:MAG: type II secretion system F family protein [Clostridiales bacterium]|nr:type II secretion system F family protein [Clostridiales bacterium]